MINTKAKGSRIELKFKEYFKSFDYHVTKAGGSFGIDLVAIKKDKPNLFINVKALRKYCGPKERKELIDLSIKHGALPILAYKLKSYGKYCIEVLNPTDHVKTGLSNSVILGPISTTFDKHSHYATDLYFVLECPMFPVYNHLKI